jgi:phage major head subunit gpT-like protein
VANKMLLEAFMHDEQSWRQIARVRSVNNVHQHSYYRLVGDFVYEEVGATGELKHARTGEEGYTNQARTFGRMYAITRQDLINDDLGAFDDLREMVGRGGGLKLNEVFWETFLDNAAFFAGAAGNYFEGAATALSGDSLAVAEQMLRAQRGADDHPLGLRPRILLVPPGLDRAAQELMTSDYIAPVGGGSARERTPTRNVWQNAFTPVSSDYLNDANFTGASNLAWYLLADPARLSCIEVVFLNGVEVPTVEGADADFDTLGIQVRGYHDWGVALTDPRAGVKSKGEA